VEEEKNDFLGWLKQEFAMEGIESPLPEAKGTVMVLITTSAGRALIGSMANLCESGLQEVFLPLMYAEGVQHTSEGVPAGVQPMMAPIFHVVGVLPFHFLQPESVYYLRSDRTNDKRLVQEYERAILDLRSKESGIVIPNAQDAQRALRPVP